LNQLKRYGSGDERPAANLREALTQFEEQPSAAALQGALGAGL
jgi:hypothetical protein